MNIIYEILVKFLSFISVYVFHHGGETWPGEIVLKLNPSLLKELSSLFSYRIFVIGTNGKTSTAKLIRTIFKKAKYEVIGNTTGANMINGLVSTILTQKKPYKNSEYVGVFEIDEYALSVIAKYIQPTHVVVLNTLRDQLDRYGEVENILTRWEEVFKSVTDTVTIYANASDPGVYRVFSSIKKNQKVQWYGVPEKYLSNSKRVLGDYVFCHSCGGRLEYAGVYVAHIGTWRCDNCGNYPIKYFVYSRSDLEHLKNLPSYSVINSEPVYLLSKEVGIDSDISFASIMNFDPAFGRGESIKSQNNNMYHIHLGKNPAGWTLALEHLLENQETKVLLLGLNNRIPDGHDISWIWDASIEKSQITSASRRNKLQIIVVGDRCYDMAVRLKAEGINNVLMFESAEDSIRKINNSYSGCEIAVLANYSSMLEIRKVITGKAIN